MKKQEKKKKPVPIFTFTIDGHQHKVPAYTKGEARALLRKKLEVEKLPTGCGQSATVERRPA